LFIRRSIAALRRARRRPRAGAPRRYTRGSPSLLTVIVAMAHVLGLRWLPAAGNLVAQDAAITAPASAAAAGVGIVRADLFAIHPAALLRASRIDRARNDQKSLLRSALQIGHGYLQLANALPNLAGDVLGRWRAPPHFVLDDGARPRRASIRCQVSCHEHYCFTFGNMSR
jgi:hypothetical protein